jgi:RNA polymerase sigma-70 factor (ECF subfamily)
VKPYLDDERALVAALRAGDEDAFAGLVERHHAMLVRLAGIWLPEAAAQEVAQETWVAVIEGLSRFEERSSLKTWIVGILMNKARSRARADARTIPLDASSDPDVPPVDPARFSRIGRWRSAPDWWDERTPERLVVASEALDVVERAIAGLPPGQRAVLVMRDVEGWTAAEVCNALSISETNQRVLLHRARSRLRNVLEAYVGRRRERA